MPDGRSRCDDVVVRSGDGDLLSGGAGDRPHRQGLCSWSYAPWSTLPYSEFWFHHCRRLGKSQDLFCGDSVWQMLPLTTALVTVASDSQTASVEAADDMIRWSRKNGRPVSDLRVFWVAFSTPTLLVGWRLTCKHLCQRHLDIINGKLHWLIHVHVKPVCYCWL